MINKQYCNMNYQRSSANRSPVCNCCGGGRVRRQVISPKTDDPGFKVAICPVCDTAPATDRLTASDKENS